MSLPIKDTPHLTGKDAERFAKAMENPTPVSKNDYERAKKTYEECNKKWAKNTNKSHILSSTIHKGLMNEKPCPEPGKPRT